MVDSLHIAYVMQNAGNDIAEDVGPAILIKYTILGLQKAGHKVDLLTLKGQSVIGTNDVSSLNSFWDVPLGLSGKYPFKLFESGIRRLQRILRLPYYALFDTFRFFEACYRCLPQYTLCHEYAGLFSTGAALACWRLGVPYILTVDADLLLEAEVVGKPLRGLHALVAAWETKLTYKLAQKIICVSKPAKEHLVNSWQVNPKKIMILPNGVDIKRFKPSCNSQKIRTQLGIQAAELVVTFVGGFQPWHGLEILLESFTEILREVPHTKLLLVGDGPVRSIIEQKFDELGIENSVIITGFVPHSQIPEILAASDVVTVPYPRLPEEMWFSPLKLYEYMAAGKAIVASRAGQIAEVIQNGKNGVLVEPGNIEELAQAITTLLKNPTTRKRLGQNARNQAVQHHSWKQHIKRLEEVYMDVCKTSNPIHYAESSE